MYQVQMTGTQRYAGVIALQTVLALTVGDIAMAASNLKVLTKNPIVLSDLAVLGGQFLGLPSPDDEYTSTADYLQDAIDSGDYFPNDGDSRTFDRIVEQFSGEVDDEERPWA